MGAELQPTTIYGNLTNTSLTLNKASIIAETLSTGNLKLVPILEGTSIALSIPSVGAGIYLVRPRAVIPHTGTTSYLTIQMTLVPTTKTVYSRNYTIIRLSESGAYAHNEIVGKTNSTFVNITGSGIGTANVTVAMGYRNTASNANNIIRVSEDHGQILEVFRLSAGS